MIDIAQVCLFVRMTFSDFSVKEELLSLLRLRGTTRGEDIFNVVMEFAASTKFPLCKVAAITTDGAPSITGKHVGFIGHVDVPSLMHCHCIIHQETLCSHSICLQHVMDIVI